MDAGQLGGIDTEKPPAGAGVLVDAGRAVGPVALAEGDLAEPGVVLELGPLLAGRGAQLAERAQGAAVFDEVLMRGDDLCGTT